MQRKSERLFRIYQRLKTVPQTIDELHRWVQQVDLGIGRRTLYRYLEELGGSINEPGFELVVTNNESKELRWHVVRSKRTSDKRRKDAIRSYYILKNLSGKHIHSLSSGYLDALEQELNQSSEPEHKDGFLNNHLLVTGWAEAEYTLEDTQLLLKLVHAIEQREYMLLELVPQLSAEQPIDGKHEWAIHYMVNHRGSLYIAATRKGQRRFHFLDIESVSSIHPTRQRFRRHPSGSEVQKELSKRFGITVGDGPVHDIVIQFHASTSHGPNGMRNPFIEKRNWHPTQRFQYDGDGHVVLRFKSQINRELVGWLFMWLDHIRVLGPPELVKTMERKLDDMKQVLNGRDPLFSVPKRF